MAIITLKGEQTDTLGELPAVGSKAPDFELVKGDLSDVALEDFKGQTVLLNIFPSIDTGVCQKSVRAFNEKATSVENVTILTVSADLPFALTRFCEAEGLDKVIPTSCFRSTFPSDYELEIISGPLCGLCSRVIIIIKDGVITYTEQVPEIAQEPDYEAAIQALSL